MQSYWYGIYVSWINNFTFLLPPHWPFNLLCGLIFITVFLCIKASLIIIHQTPQSSCYKFPVMETCVVMNNGFKNYIKVFFCSQCEKKTKILLRMITKKKQWGGRSDEGHIPLLFQTSVVALLGNRWQTCTRWSPHLQLQERSHSR